MKLKLSDYTITASIPGTASNEDIRILFAARTGKMIHVKNILYKRLKKGNLEGIPAAVVSMLMDYQILVPGHEDEWEYVLQRNKAISMDSRKRKCLVLDFREKQPDKRRLSIQLQQLISMSAKQTPVSLFIFCTTDTVKNQQDIADLQELLLPFSSAQYKLHLIGVDILSSKCLQHWYATFQMAHIDLLIKDNCNSSREEQLLLLEEMLTDMKGFITPQNFRTFILTDISDSLSYTFWINELHSKSLQLAYNIQIVPDSAPIANLSAKVRAELELPLLKLLKTHRFMVNVIPTTTAKFTTTLAMTEDNFRGFYVINGEGLPDKDDLSFISQGIRWKTFPDNSFYKLLRTGRSACSKCRLLPICGGSLESAVRKNPDCPAYKYNLIDRIHIFSKSFN